MSEKTKYKTSACVSELMKMINLGQLSTKHLVSLDTDSGAYAGSCLVWRLHTVFSARRKLGQTPRHTGAYTFCAAGK